jgi:hypothetical protein
MTDVDQPDASGDSLGIQVHTEHEEHSDYHDHVDYSSASLVSAMLCLGCGSYVAGGHLVRHQRFHDRVQEALVRASGSDYSSPEEVPLF